MLLDSLWFAQSIGLLACLVGATAFMQRQDSKLRAHLTLNGTLMGLHFLLLGSSVAAINCLLCAVRNWVSGYYRGLGAMLLFLVLAWSLVIPQVSHPVQLLTLLGTTLSTFALFAGEYLLHSQQPHHLQALQGCPARHPGMSAQRSGQAIHQVPQCKRAGQGLLFLILGG